MLTAAADKAGQIPYRTLSSPPLHPSSSTSSVRQQNAYHQGNPLITTATHSITVRRTKNQSFQWWRPSCHITYLNRLSVNHLPTDTTAICRSHYTHIQSCTPQRGEITIKLLCFDVSAVVMTPVRT